MRIGNWAGQTAAIVDDETGEIIDAYVFVAVLPFSGYAVRDNCGSNGSRFISLVYLAFL